MSNVFIIINEWTDFLGNTSSQVTGGKYFDSEDAAFDALQVIANSYGVVILGDATSVSFEEPSRNIDFEEYYIQELTRA